MHVYTFFFKSYSVMVYHRVLSIVRLNFTVAKCFLLCSGQDKSTRNLRKRKVLVYSGLPWWRSGEELACHGEDAGSTPGSGRSPEIGNGKPLQYSCLENPVDRSLAGYSQQGRRVKHY